MRPSEEGSFFQAGWNESKEWYAMIKTYKNIIISAGYQWFYTKPSEQGSFFQVVCYDQNLQKLAGLVNGLEPHLPPLSSQKNKMPIFGLHSTSDDRLSWSMDCHPSLAKKMKCLFLEYVQPLMISQVISATNGDWNAKKGP